MRTIAKHKNYAACTFSTKRSGRRRNIRVSNRRRCRPILEALETRLVLSGTTGVVDFTQGANGDLAHSPPLGDVTWINGILNPNNSEYFEGVSTLQRVFLDGMSSAAGNVHKMTFGHLAVKDSAEAHAYDFLTSWNQSLAATGQIAPGTLVDPYTDGPDANNTIEACEPGSASPGNFRPACLALHNGANIIDVAIPDNMGSILGDNVATRVSAYEGFFGNRTLRMYGDAPITAASLVFDGHSGSNPTANYTLTWTSSSTRILIEFGAHLAQGNDFMLSGVGYGSGRGAGSISGGPYHVFLYDLDDASLGSQDNQIQANAVQAPPSFEIDKSGPELSKIGDVATYTFTVTHTGESDSAGLNLVSIVDDKIGNLASAVPASCTTLSPGETCSFSVDFTIPPGAADPFVNTVTATYAIAGLSLVQLTRTDTHTTNLFQPSIAVTKNATAPSPLCSGDQTSCEFTIAN